MGRQKLWFKVQLCSLLFISMSILTVTASSTENNSSSVQNATGTSSLPEVKESSGLVLASSTNSTAVPVLALSTVQAETIIHAISANATAPPPVVTSAAATNIHEATTKVQPEHPPTIPHFIHKMMVRFGEAKASEALQSLDQLPLGLVMKILLVEMDKDLAADIVAMQRYAQNTDKTILMMIGRIVAGDKNIPKELFAMDVKLMKYPWWVRLRSRMMSNIEKYVQAFSLVPASAKTAIHQTHPVKVPTTEVESSNKIVQQQQQPALVNPALSFLNPFQQQQQLLGALALAKAASASNTQAQQLFLKAQQTQQANPFSFI